MFLNLVQLAESFGVPEKTVEGWIRHEGLPHTPDRGQLLFDRAEVAEWAATRGLAAQAGFLAPESSRLAANWRLGPLLRTGGIWREVSAAEVPEIFARIATALPGTTPPVRQMLGQRLRATGGVSFAPVGGGFALPHPSARITLGRHSGLIALLVLREALPRADLSVDDVPVTRLLFFIAPSPRAHLDLLGKLCRLLADGSVARLLDQGATDEEIFRMVDARDAASSQTRIPAGNR